MKDKTTPCTKKSNSASLCSSSQPVFPSSIFFEASYGRELDLVYRSCWGTCSFTAPCRCFLAFWFFLIPSRYPRRLPLRIACTSSAVMALWFLPILSSFHLVLSLPVRLSSNNSQPIKKRENGLRSDRPARCRVRDIPTLQLSLKKLFTYLVV